MYKADIEYRANEDIYEDGEQLETVNVWDETQWCQDPETSSMTARKPRGCDGDDRRIQRWHDKQKHWFDSYQEVTK